jgi:hypothetical protein
VLKHERLRLFIRHFHLLESPNINESCWRARNEDAFYEIVYAREANIPDPSPRKTETVLAVLLATTMSNLPSKLTSAVAANLGAVAAANAGDA